jgi:hypothetical protein
VNRYQGLGIRLVVLAVVLVFVAGCAPEKDPRNIADGYATKAGADRLDDQKAYELAQDLIVDTIENTEKQARLDIFVAVKEHIVTTSVVTLYLLTMVFIPTAGLYMWHTGKNVTAATERLVLAVAAKAEMEASLIRLDRTTRTFPVQLKELDGKIYVVNHNTDRKFLLSGSEDVPATPQMVAAFAQAVTSGLLAMEARKSKGNAGTASHFGTIDPTVISLDAMSGELMEAR